MRREPNQVASLSKIAHEKIVSRDFRRALREAAGAPKLADTQAWDTRIDRGVAAMVTNAINGISSETGVMPAKGGFAHLSDDEWGTTLSHCRFTHVTAVAQPLK